MDISETQRVIGWDAAARAVRAAVEAAAALGLRINVAVVDRSGVPAAFLRMPGAPLHSVGIALDKAYTAASFGLATSRWSEVLTQHSEAVRVGLTQRPRFVAFGGGVPLMEAGELIGAIGVSGATEDEDEQCALAGARAIGLAD